MFLFEIFDKIVDQIDCPKGGSSGPETRKFVIGSKFMRQNSRLWSVQYDDGRRVLEN
jgi:hypothetical protein